MIERLIHREIVDQGYANPPVIKWLTDPFEAFAYVNKLSLDELLQVDATRLWRRAGPPVSTDDDRLDVAAVLGGRIAGVGSVGRTRRSPHGAKASLKGSGYG